jgi:pimeloyl-ACP methyl ester carboxylesterase
VGHSLGGLIVLDLAQRFSNQYDGVAALCGPIGGTQAEFDHMVNTRLLFDMFYPGILPGTFNQIPAGLIITPAMQGQIVAAITANPTGLAIIASIAQSNLQFNPASPAAQTQTVQSLITALSFHARGADNVLSLMNGFPFDNSQTVYSAAPISLLPPAVLNAVLAQVNANVPRTSGDPSALNYTDRNFAPSGALQIPTLTMHNRWDPLVPFFHEPMLAGRVNAAGAGGLLVQRTKLEYGHCNFTVDEQVTAITDLNAWVATGIKPAS